LLGAGGGRDQGGAGRLPGQARSGGRPGVVRVAIGRKRSHGGRTVRGGGEAGEGAQAGPEPTRDRVLEDGREGGRMLGALLLARVRQRDGAARQGIRDRRDQARRRQEELPVPERHDARLRPAGADGWLHLRQPQGEVELWMRHVVLGVAGSATPTERARRRARSHFGEGMDHFEVFGLPRRLASDGAELQRKFYELSRRGHPDFHQGAPPERQAEILEASARLNAAYRALRDPIARIEYLVRLEEGRDTREGATVKAKAPPELLEEMFEIQESLQEAQSSNEPGGLAPGARETLGARRERLLARYGEEEARLCGPLSEAWDASEPA